MKKLLSGILLSSLLLSISAVSFATEENLVDSASSVVTEASASDFQFADGVLTAYLGAGGDVVIPSRINGEEVHTIGAYCFSENVALLSVTIPSTVTSIGDYAFSDCVHLQSVTMADSVTGIGECAFGFCYALESLYLSQSLTSIGQWAFSSCNALTSVVIPKSLAVIGESIFIYCESLESVTFPVSVTAVEPYAFFDCPVLDKVYYEGTEEDRAKISGLNTDNQELVLSTWVYESEMPFVEVVVPNTSYPVWAEMFIAFVSPEIMPDISTSNYGSDASRGTIAQALYNMCGGGSVTGVHSFTDVGEYENAIAWCHENAVMNGISSTEFGTESKVTREQLALILQKASVALGQSTSNPDEIVLRMFSDEGAISSWARGGMAWAVANSLMTGNNNELNPKGNITRAEVSVMLYYFHQLG